MLSSPLELEILLHYFYSSMEMFPTRSKMVGELEDRLIEEDMLEFIENAMQQCNVRITEKGKFFVKHLLAIKFPEPVNTFVIPE